MNMTEAGGQGGGGLGAQLMHLGSHAPQEPPIRVQSCVCFCAGSLDRRGRMRQLGPLQGGGEGAELGAQPPAAAREGRVQPLDIAGARVTPSFWLAFCTHTHAIVIVPMTGPPILCVNAIKNHCHPPTQPTQSHTHLPLPRPPHRTIAHTCAHKHTCAHAHAHMYTCTHARTRTCSCTHAACAARGHGGCCACAEVHGSTGLRA